MGKRWEGGNPLFDRKNDEFAELTLEFGREIGLFRDAVVVNSGPEKRELLATGMETRKSWSEAEVNALIGQSESVRLEFKSGAMLRNQDEGKWRDELSKQVSAFANTEGGELILGMEEEKKAGARVASKVDGVPAALPQERLQQIIEGNISPHLLGLRVQRVKLSALPDWVVFVIQVPQGVTAYQANDGRYYGRSEFEVKYLRDQEVRLRMTREESHAQLFTLA